MTDTIPPYATDADLTAYIGTLPDNSTRLILRAGELIDSATRNRIDITLAAHVTAAKAATCAQVEYWIEVGEDVDIAGPVQSKQTNSVQLLYGAGDNRTAPLYLAPRAQRILQSAGLLSRGVICS